MMDKAFRISVGVATFVIPFRKVDYVSVLEERSPKVFEVHSKDLKLVVDEKNSSDEQLGAYYAYVEQVHERK
jgi:hypothetical protein